MSKTRELREAFKTGANWISAGGMQFRGPDEEARRLYPGRKILIPRLIQLPSRAPAPLTANYRLSSDGRIEYQAPSDGLWCKWLNTTDVTSLRLLLSNPTIEVEVDDE